MVSVLETAKELIRQNEIGSLVPNSLAMQILKLQRLTAISSQQPMDDIADVRDKLELYADIRARHIIEGVSARVMDAIEIKDNNNHIIRRDKKELTRYLDSLIERLTESEGDLIEQLVGSIVKDDTIMVVPQREIETGGISGDDGNIIEKAIIEAADIILEQNNKDYVINETDEEEKTNNNNKKKKNSINQGRQLENSKKNTVIKVLVVKVHPDDCYGYDNNYDGDNRSNELGSADQMSQRLNKIEGIEAMVIDDNMITSYMRQCTKVIIYAWMVDIDEGIGCRRGSSMMVGIANRMRVGTIGICSKFRMMPMGSKCVQGMSMTQRFPGKVWDYQDSRNDKSRESVTIVAPMIDVISTQKFDVIVTETGGYSPDYLVHIIPVFERSMTADDDDGEGPGDMQGETSDLEDENIGARGSIPLDNNKIGNVDNNNVES